MARRVGATAEVTREQLLDAAEAQFSLKGYASATNQDIATVAGLTAGAIYHYYGSKAELYAAVCERAIRQLAARFLTDVRGGVTLEDAVARLLFSALSHNRQRPNVAGLLANFPMEARHPEVSDTARRALAAIRELLGDVVDAIPDDPRIRHFDREALIDVFVAVTDGFARFAAETDTEREARMLTTFGRMLGIEPHPPGEVPATRTAASLSL
ncbi:TetR/AcrR family transcriptional regulator [Sporichthya polymorpha]|uniref:TetR/AcrR family transcriptional regulator n=1 Tax=Sporichthya polymorpha TaxID=35751 RepID=UPI00036EC25B|nr:TetR family transcriptional regulator [Sporichthya polymorpha]